MRRATILIAALALVLALGTAARADEIIKFTNGTYLSIKSHDLFEGMVRVTLGSEAAMSSTSSTGWMMGELRRFGSWAPRSRTVMFASSLPSPAFISRCEGAGARRKGGRALPSLRRTC